MAPRKTGKRVETEVIDVSAMSENNDVSASKKKKNQIEEQVTKEVRLPRAAKNKKFELESISAKSVPRQKSAIKKVDSVEKKSSGKNSSKKIEVQVDDTEKVEEYEEIEKPIKKSRGKAEKKLDIPIEKNHEIDIKSKVEEKASPVTKKGKGRGSKVAEVVSKKARAKKDAENEVSTPNSDIKDEANEKEIEGVTETKENGVESEALENGKEEMLEEKTETKLIKKGKGKAAAKKGKTASKPKVIAETNGDNVENAANESETGVTNSV